MRICSSNIEWHSHIASPYKSFIFHHVNISIIWIETDIMKRRFLNMIKGHFMQTLIQCLIDCLELTPYRSPVFDELLNGDSNLGRQLYLHFPALFLQLIVFPLRLNKLLVLIP